MVLRRRFRRRNPAGLLFPVIGMSREYFLGPVNLFDKHDAGKHVWPGRCAERQHEVRVFAVFRRQTASATDQECDITSLIAPCTKLSGEVLTAECFTAFVHGDPDGAGWKCSREKLAFTGFKLRGREFASFFDLHDFEWPLNTFGVFGDQIAFRAGF